MAVDDDLGFIDPRHMFVLNLGFGPLSILFGVMITLMTISTRGFVAMVTGVVMPYGAAYCLRDIRFRSNLSLRLPAKTYR